ncbi:hypothetical protein LUZ60_009207 [Juncus effusus]|nr:hypothetical protein LUZ60_009207 [Juncus effusus]
MEPNRVSFRDGRLASRKAEEAALRRYEAAAWLESMVGPICLSKKPSEQEFVSCLRNGLILCNTINRIQPKKIKVVTNPLVRTTLDNQPLPAFQYFENIRNFLVAIEELKLPSFEASDLDRDNLDIGSVMRIVDCIIALKCYYEFQQRGEISGFVKNIKSPIFAQGNMCLTPSSSFIHKKRLDLTAENDNKNKTCQNESKKKGEDNMDSLVKLICESMINSKENIDQKLMDISGEEKADPIKLLNKIISSCMDKQVNSDNLQQVSMEGNVLNDISELHNKDQNLSSHQASFDRLCLLEAQEREIREVREMLKGVKLDFENLQSQVQSDYKNLVHEIQGLSSAASKYNEAIKENRNLYNMLQELRGNIRVFCRVRPLNNSESKSTIEHISDDGSLIIFDPLKPQNARKIFQFNKIFGPNATQGDVYKETRSLIRSIVDGYNVCIFAYGQTGSGKTHTMCGPSGGSTNDRGISYMALNDLFNISRKRSDMKYEIQVQMVEIYNEQVRDLLAEDSSSTKLEIRTCAGNNNGQLTLPEATLMRVESTDDVIDLMKLGEKNRACGSTAMNNRSSRSHSVLIVHVHGERVDRSESTDSCLYLVDLAGSERVDRSEASGDRLREAQHINKSLSCLGDVIMALSQKGSHVPYRNSKLTQLLQKSLGGNAKMLMFAHVSPDEDSYNETIGTLKFAQRAATVELGAAKVNKESSEIKDLKEQIESLKKALAAKETERTAHSSSKTKDKENFPNLDKTPPRFRRMSLETPKSGIVQKSPICYSKPPLVSESPNSVASQLNTRFHGEGIKEKSVQRSFVANNPNEFATNNYKIKSQFGYSSQFGNSSDQMNGQDESTSQKKTVRSNNVASKGSNIRKSIQNLGKLINGSDKRSNNNLNETPPSNRIRTDLDAKTPIISSDARSRRQSLTNTQQVNFMRRSSLGGRSDSYLNEAKNVKTPNVVRSSMATTKKWI